MKSAALSSVNAKANQSFSVTGLPLSVEWNHMPEDALMINNQDIKLL